MAINKNITLEGARIGFRNFSGKEGRFNPAGRRNFCVFLDSDIAPTLQEDGWNIKYLTPREPGDEPQAYLQVAVSYANIPPKIVLITGNGKTVLNETNVGMLDWAEISNVDLIIRPYNYDVNGKVGVKAYCKTMYVTIEEDEFEKKYYDVPDSAANSLKDEDLDDIPFV